LIKPMFIVGLPRTGSTLWAKVISQNPDILIFDEMHYLSPFRKDFRYVIKNKVGDLRSDDNVRKMVDLLFSETSVDGIRGGFWVEIKGRKQKLKPILSMRILESDRSLGSIFRILIVESTRAFGYNHCLVKFPVHFAYAKQLRAWFPKAKIIQITRDPRATAVSKSSDSGGTERLVKKHPGYKKGIIIASKVYVILQYIWSSYIHQKMQATKDYELFSFEELLFKPEHTLRKLCGFLEIEYTDAMLNPSKGQPSSITGQFYKGLNAEAAIRWRNKMPKRESNFIHFLTKQSMARLGYCHEYYGGCKSQLLYKM
jgi:Sulfotransferase family